MRKTLKWTMPAALALVALIGWSFRSAVAQNAAAKGKITVTVKGAMGEIGSSVEVRLLKGNVPAPARGGGGGGGAPPASQPTPLKTGLTDAKGVYTFADVDAGEYTVAAGRGGGGGGRRNGGGGGGAAAPTSGPTPGATGRGQQTGMVKAGEELKLEITLQGRGGGGGQGGGGQGGGGRRGAGGGGGAPPAGGAAPAPGRGA